MDADHVVEGASGRLTSGIIEQDNLVMRAIEFVYKKLPEWRDDPELPKPQSEPMLNPHLAKFLERHARNDFASALFFHEEPQPGRGRADISVSPTNAAVIFGKLYSCSTPFLIIECKRLPAPSKDREREYLTGGDKRTGGIQRFKLCLHSPNEKCAAMVGYIQSHDSKYWHGIILSWMRELARIRQTDGTNWKNDACVEPLKYNSSIGSARWLSHHSRTGSISSGAISLHHLWIEMPDDSTKKSQELDGSRDTYGGPK